MARAMLYAVVTAKWGGGDVAGTLYDHQGEPIHGHMSSGEAWLWRDLTIGFADRAKALEDRYPDGYDVTCIGADADPSLIQPLYSLWDERHPGWRDEVKP